MSTRIDSHTWVASGPAGVVGAIRSIEDGYVFRLAGEDDRRVVYPSLEVAKNALVSALPPGTGRPEFVEH